MDKVNKEVNGLPGFNPNTVVGGCVVYFIFKTHQYLSGIYNTRNDTILVGQGIGLNWVPFQRIQTALIR